MNAADDLHLLKSLRSMSLFGLRHLLLLGRKKPSPQFQTAENEFHGKNPNSKRPRIVQTQKLCWFLMAQRFSRAKRRQTKTCLQENFRKLRRYFVWTL